MFKRLIAATAATGLLLGAPSFALAQSAGDNQYQDPLGGGSGGGSGSSGSSGSSGNAPAPAPAQAAPAPKPRAATAAPKQAELPRTGTEPLLVALVGGAMLLAGGGLRLAAPRRDA